jgi:hypothetical protein
MVALGHRPPSAAARGKSDPLDTEAAAHAVQAPQGAIPKVGDVQVR